MSEPITMAFLKGVLTAIIKSAAKIGTDNLKKNYHYVQLLNEFGFKKPEDNFDSIYIHSIILFASNGEKDDELVKLFLEDEVKKAFIRSYKLYDFTGFDREINHQLHVNPLVNSIKNWTEVPREEIEQFKEIFKQLNQHILSPTDSFIINEIKDNNIKHHDISLEILNEVKKLTNPNTGDLTEELNKEYKARLDQIKAQIDNEIVEGSLQNLIDLKDRNWEKFNEITKYRVLTNIGICYLKLSKVKESAPFFVDALQYKPNDKEALSNAANGYLFNEEITKAIEIAEKLKQIDSLKSLAIKIRAGQYEEIELEEILKETDKKNEDTLLAATNFYVNKQMYEEAEKHCNELVTENDSRIIYKEFYAQIITNLYGNQNHFVVREIISSNASLFINKAIEFCSECWKYYSKTDLRESKLYILVHKSLLFHLIRDDEKALETIDLVLAENENDDYALKHKGMYLATLNKHEQAIKAYLKAQDKGKDIIGLLAISYQLNGQQTEALELLESAVKDNVSNDSFTKNIYSLLLNSYRNSIDEEFEKARLLIENALQKFPDDVTILSDISAYYAIFPQLGDSKTILDKALFIAKTTKVSNKDLLILSDELIRQERIEEAVEIKESFVDTSINNPITYNLANLYYKLGRKEKALEIYSKLREEYGVIEGVTKNEIRIYQEIGDYKKAGIVATQYVQHFDDINAKIVLNGINIRLENYREVEEFLNETIDFSILNLSEIHTLIAQMFKMNMSQKAINLVYELKRNFDNKDFNELYMQTVFTSEENQKNKFLESKTVELDTVVFLKEKSGNVFYYVLENRNTKLLKPNEINSEHPIFNKIIGKKVGDIIKYESHEFVTDTYEIVEIKHKLIHSFNESMEKISTVYKGQSEFISMDSSELLEGRLPKFIELQMEKGEKRSQQIQSIIEDYYYTHKCTIGSLASITGNHPISVWTDLTNNNKIGVQVCLGNKEELDDAISIVNQKKELCVDFISLITIYQLNDVRDCLINKFGKLKITHSVYDLVKELLEKEVIFSSGESMTLYAKKGKKFFTSRTAEEKKEQINNLKSFIQWIKDFCEIEPCKALLKLDSSTIEEQNKIFHKSFYETCLLAKEKNYLLVSDDYTFRRICKEEFQLDGVWTQILLMNLVADNSITIEQYHKSLIFLNNHNYKHTAIDANTLFYIIEQSEWETNNDFRNAIKVLQGNNSTPNSIIVAVQFLSFLLNNQKATIDQKRKIIRLVIQEYLTSRSIFNHIIWIRESVRILFRNEYYKMDFILKELDDYINVLNKTIGNGKNLFKG